MKHPTWDEIRQRIHFSILWSALALALVAQQIAHYLPNIGFLDLPLKFFNIIPECRMTFAHTTYTQTESVRVITPVSCVRKPHSSVLDAEMIFDCTQVTHSHKLKNGFISKGIFASVFGFVFENEYCVAEFAIRAVADADDVLCGPNA